MAAELGAAKEAAHVFLLQATSHCLGLHLPVRVPAGEGGVLQLHRSRCAVTAGLQEVMSSSSGPCLNRKSRTHLNKDWLCEYLNKNKLFHLIVLERNGDKSGGEDVIWREK